MTESNENIENEFLLQLLNHIPSNIFWKNKDGVYLGCNDAFAQSVGFSFAHEVIGKNDFDLPTTKEESEAYRADDLQVMNSGKSKLNIVEEQTTADGAIRYILTSKAPLTSKQDEVIGVLGVYSDITELKQTQIKLDKARVKAESANKAKSEFIANMSHDLRLPMTGVIGMLEELLASTDDIQSALPRDPQRSPEKLAILLDDLISRANEYAGLAKNSADELIQLFNEILEVVQLESGKLDETPAVFDLNQLLQHCIHLLQPVAKQKKLTLSVEINSQIPRYLKGINRYLDRILVNLVSNSLKFTKKGMVIVKVGLADKPPANGYQPGDSLTLKIQVHDTGIGIPSDKFEIIFEHFSRLTPSYEGIYKGSGLGLSAVKNYVKAMQGTIEVDSEEEKGSCFTLTLPLTVETQSALSQNLAQLPTRDPPKKKLTQSITPSIKTRDQAITSGAAHVLLVEDNPMAANAIRLALQRLKCTVDWAKDGGEAIQKASTNVYDLIFMDVGLPDITGIEVTERIRSLTDDQRSLVPIVALTGHAGGEHRTACLEAGMQDILTKPAQSMALQSALATWVWNQCKTKIAEQDSSASILPEATGESALPVIDWEGCLSLFPDDMKTVQELLSLLAKDLKTMTVPVLAKSYAQQDTLALCEELHRCLGGVVYLKLPRLEKRLRDFQRAVKAEPQQQKTLDVTYQTLQKTIDAFLTAVDSM